jgi:hypothetical protein
LGQGYLRFKHELGVVVSKGVEVGGGKVERHEILSRVLGFVQILGGTGRHSRINKQINNNNIFNNIILKNHAPVRRGGNVESGQIISGKGLVGIRARDVIDDAVHEVASIVLPLCNTACRIVLNKKTKNKKKAFKSLHGI